MFWKHYRIKHVLGKTNIAGDVMSCDESESNHDHHARVFVNEVHRIPQKKFDMRLHTRSWATHIEYVRAIHVSKFNKDTA